MKLLLPLLVALAGAAEDTTELRLLAGGYPGYREAPAAGGGRLALDDHRGAAIHGEAVLRYDADAAVHPWLLAGGAIHRAAATDALGAEHEAVAYAGMLGAGIGLRAGPALIEAGLVAGLGDALVGDDRDGDAAPGDSASYLLGEARVGLWLGLGRTLVGAVAGSAVHRAMPETREDGSPDSTDTYVGDGAFLLVGVGWRL